MNSTNLWIIRQIWESLKQAKSDKKYFSGDKDFTRDRDLPFEAVFLMLLDLPKRSIGIELEDVLETMNLIDNKERDATPAAFSKARKKIDPELFEMLNDKLVDLYYTQSEGKDLKKWKGFILQAIDGSVADMVDTAGIRSEFGVQANQHGSIPQGRMMCIYDVLNGLTRKSYLGNLSVGEATVVKQWVEKLEDNTLTLYGRLYPGMVLLFMHHYHKKEYVMRCKLGFNERVKDFVGSGKKERVEYWELSAGATRELRQLGINVKNKATFRVRLLRVKLKNGEVEVLVTSLVDRKKYPCKLFKKLYALRWGVEVNFGFLKNTLQVEINSGRSVQSVYQDFYATILRANLQALIEQDCEDQVKEKTKSRKLKYKINKNIAAGVLKRRIVRLFFGRSFKNQYERLKKLLVKYLCPIKPGRSQPRIKKSQKLNGKYKPMKNYKRAA